MNARALALAAFVSIAFAAPARALAAPRPAVQLATMARGSLTYAEEAPPVDGLRTTAEVLGSGLGMIAGGAVGFRVGLAVDDSYLSPAPLVGFGGGVLLGSSLGAYTIGCLGDETGSFGTTLLGATAGTGVGLLAGVPLLLVAGEARSAPVGALAAIALVGGPIAGSVVGFNLSREYEPGVSPSRRSRERRRAARADAGFTLRPTALVTAELSSFGAAGTF